MATAPVAATSSIASAATSSLNLNDPLRVLLTELTHQDPFKPVDNTDFMAQIAQFASLDSSQQINQSMNQLLTLQAINQTVGLIGRNVTAVTSAGATIRGTVSTLTLTNGLPRMTIKTSTGDFVPDVSINELQQVN